jgi:Flp pilus assembly protein TadG
MMLRSRLRRTRSERGAALLEFAIVTPLLVLLAFATAETGLAWVSNNKVEGAASQAARVAASSGNRPEADVSTLLAIKAALPADELANLKRVVIYKSTTANGVVPSGCVPSLEDGSDFGVNNVCNSYSGALVRSVTTTTTLSSSVEKWLPSVRKDTLGGPPDYVGIWIQTVHTNLTKTFFGDFTITKSSVYRIQPDF